MTDEGLARVEAAEDHVRGLGFLRAQKLPARGQIEEQLPHLDARARRTTGRFHFHDLAAVDDDLRAFRRGTFPLARRQRETADTCDARQRFTTKTKGRNAK